MKAWKAAAVFGIASMVLAHGSVDRAWAWGALAVGSTGNVARDGYAIGFATNQATEDAAKTTATNNCHDFQGAPKATATCAVVTTFHGQCYAFAEDPEAGTPGVGYAVAADTATAEQKAMDACKATAGPTRVQFCQARKSACDTHD